MQLCRPNTHYSSVWNEYKRQRTIATSLFQFMIGNTAWDLETNKKFSFVNFHYTRDLWAESYDFDFSGLVNAHYADPRKRLCSNRERLYLVPMDHIDIGHARAMFRAKDSEILYLIDQFEHISKSVKLNVK